MVKPTNLGRERAAIRAGSCFLLKTDINQFYPSLYTHAVGWAVDPQLRSKANWKKTNFLGKQIDQALMDMDGKVSQGIPIGTDISFLLAEVVLAAVDKAIKPSPAHSFRWYDDYEFAFETSQEAEVALKKLNKELARYRLRLNTKKTSITRLPSPVQDEWQETLRQAARRGFSDPRDMVKYFDTAFRLRDDFPDANVLAFTLGHLFKVVSPAADVARIANSCITQTILCEPGTAQKAFALFSFWHLNGLSLDTKLITSTINQVVLRHEARGFSSDVAWALAFCLEQKVELSSKAAQILSAFHDDFTALQALHMHAVGLLPKKFDSNGISRFIKCADLDREHWLIAYESVRHGFLSTCERAVKKNLVFSDLLGRGVTFYRTALPEYASIIHPGGAPEWIVRDWIEALTSKTPRRAKIKRKRKVRDEEPALLKLMGKDVARLKRGKQGKGSPEDVVAKLMDILGPAETRDWGSY
jgi:hypothetical protein